MSWYDWLIVVVAFERLAELIVSQRHVTWAFAHGGIETGKRHYPPMVALHTGLLVACVVEVHVADRPFIPALGWTALAFVVAANALRWWCIGTLGNQWSTRVIVVPGVALVRRGPYRWLSHPNYVAVAVEGAALPLVHTAWVTARRVHGAERRAPARLPDPDRGARPAVCQPGPGMTPDADLLVIGGGPVGLAVAIEGRLAGLSVIVVEPRATPVDKACGEGLMPGAVAALARLGVDPEGHTLTGIRYLRGAHTADHLFAESPGRGVRRTVLHAALAARARELGAVVVPGRAGAVEQDASSVWCAGIRGRWLLACDGLHSTVRRQVDLSTHHRLRARRFGVRRHFRVAPWTDLVEVHWGRSVEAYVTPVADDVVGVALLGPAHHDYDRTLDSFVALRHHLGDAERLGPARGAGPMYQQSQHRTAGRVRLVGDASGYVDALTGEGVRVGLAQAHAAVATLGEDVRRSNAAYEKAWTAATRDYRVVTSGLLAAAALPCGAPSCPLAVTAPGLYGAVVERLAR